MKYIYLLWQKSDFSASAVLFLLFFFIRLSHIQARSFTFIEIGAAGPGYLRAVQKKRDLLLSGLYLTLPPDSLVFPW